VARGRPDAAFAPEQLWNVLALRHRLFAALRLPTRYLRSSNAGGDVAADLPHARVRAPGPRSGATRARSTVLSRTFSARPRRARCTSSPAAS
jgi:hypothetical protein